MRSLIRLTVMATLALGLTSVVSAQEDSLGTPLEGVASDMKAASNQLSKKTTDKKTQTSQEGAVAKLDKLIAELEKERRSLGGNISPNPKIAANQSTIRQGPGGMGDLHSAREQGNRWGDLPAHERDRILQSLTEGFPAHYQGILEAYYKRLAVEKKADGDEANAKDSRPAKPAKTETKADQPAKKAAE